MLLRCGTPAACLASGLLLVLLQLVPLLRLSTQRCN
jgi:hypothetical protein